MRFSLHYKISKVFLQEFWLFFGGKTHHFELPLRNIVGFFSPITWVFSSCISSLTVTHIRGQLAISAWGNTKKMYTYVLQVHLAGISDQVHDQKNR